MQDYFQFFNIDRKFNVDLSVLRKQYILNNKKYHPDFHTLGSAVNQEEVLRLSTLNNEAYKILTDDRKRIMHVLRLENAMPEEGKAQVHQVFLMEMMDVNESLMDAKMSDDSVAIQNVADQLNTLQEELATQINQAMLAWDTVSAAEHLEVIRDTYLKQQYLRRLQDQLEDRGQEM